MKPQHLLPFLAPRLPPRIPSDQKRRPSVLCRQIRFELCRTLDQTRNLRCHMRTTTTTITITIHNNRRIRLLISRFLPSFASI